MADDCSFSKKKCFNIFSEALGKKTAIKSWQEIYTCIHAVDCGIKNAYLVDICRATPGQIERLIKRLCGEDFLSSGEELDIVVICEDTFVLHKQRVSEHLSRTVDEDNLCFIDVSQELSEPQIRNDSEFLKTVENFCVQFTEFLKPKPSNEREEDVKSFGCDLTDLNPCSIFGLILAYPVVYWCNQESLNNCLSKCPLTLYKVTNMQSLLNNSFVVTAFTFPSNLSNSCERYIKSWKDKVWEASKKQDGLILRISCEQVSLTVVVL